MSPRALLGGLLTATAISLTPAGARADAAHGPPPSWLAQPQVSAVPSVPPALPLRSLGFLALVALAGGVALLARKRLSGPSPLVSHPRLRVLDTVRLADKSHLVLTRVGERCLLLGVTSHSVRRIAWLKLSDPPAEKAPASEAEGGRPLAASAEVHDRNGFPGLLRQAFAQETAGAPPSDESPASQLAASTRDTVEPFTPRSTQTRVASGAAKGRSQRGSQAAKSAPSEEPIASLVEAQASGLAARRRR
jgi:flagellar biogenesis protein FliO